MGHWHLSHWAQLHTARPHLPAKLDRTAEATTPYRNALTLQPEAERAFITGSLTALSEPTT